MRVHGNVGGRKDVGKEIYVHGSGSWWLFFLWGCAAKKVPDSFYVAVDETKATYMLPECKLVKNV